MFEDGVELHAVHFFAGFSGAAKGSQGDCLVHRILEEIGAGVINKLAYPIGRPAHRAKPVIPVQLPIDVTDLRKDLKSVRRRWQEHQQ